MKKNVLLILILICIILFLYYPVFSAQYVWDDNLLFVDKVKLINEPLSWGLLTEPVLPNTSYFRPFIFLTMYAEFNIFGQNPVISHGFNLILFLINCVFVGLITEQIFLKFNRKNYFKFVVLSSVLYAVHPSLVESTAWISGRFDILVTTFILLGCLLYLKDSLYSRLKIFLISIVYLLALFSKELGIIFPIIIFCLYMLINVNKNSSFNIIKEFFKENKYLIVSLIFIFIFYFLLRINAMNEVYHESLDKDYIYNAYFLYVLPVHSLFFYIGETFLPFYGNSPLNPIEDLQQGALLIIKICVIFFMLLIITWLTFKRNRYVWLIYIYLFSISLVIYIIPITIANNIGHNRFLTLGLAFLAILVSIIPYNKISKKYNILLSGTCILWLVFAAFTTKNIVPMWKNDLSLWTWAYTLQPNNPLARNSYLYGSYKMQKFNNIKNVIESEQKKGKGLNLADQLLYINTLLSLNDAEVLNYAQGVYLTLPQFHKQFNNNKDYNYSLLSNYHIGTFYNTYSMAEFIFTDNISKSFEFNNISLWYLQDDQKLPVLYSRVVLLYKINQLDEARSLYVMINHQKAYKQNLYAQSMDNLLEAKCKKDLKNKQECLRELKIFHSVIGSQR